MKTTTNDNEATAALREPDAHGQAAMLLVESLMHGLVANSVITVQEAVEIVEVAIDVKKEIAADLGDSIPTLQKSLTLLNAISASLAADLDGGQPGQA